MRESIQPEDGFTLQRRAGSRRPAQKISDLAFADDIVALKDSKTAAEEVLNRISTSAREVGLTVNEQKTKFIALNEDAVNVIHLDNEESLSNRGLQASRCLDNVICQWHQVSKDTCISSNNTSEQSVESEFDQENQDPSVPSYSNTHSNVMYGSETWTLTKEQTRGLDGAYTRLLGRALNVDYQHHMTIEALYQDLPRLSEVVRGRRMKFAGHRVRTEQQPCSKLVLWRPTHGRAGQGRPRKSDIDVLD